MTDKRVSPNKIKMTLEKNFNPAKLLLLIIIISATVVWSLTPYFNAEASNPAATVSGGQPAPSGGIPGTTGGVPGLSGGQPVSDYLSSLYLWFLGFVGIAALFALVMGGVLWMFSSSLTSTAEARRWITNAIWGIVIAAASYLILNTINPDLVQGFDIQAVIKRALP